VKLQKNLSKKSLVMAIILLFIGTSIIPYVNAGINIESSNKTDTQTSEKPMNVIDVYFGTLIVRGNEPLPNEVTFIIIPLSNPNIDVGSGATIQINVSYELYAPGWHDDASCYIKIVGTDNIATATTGETETGYLNLYLDLVPGQTFIVEFYGNYTWWYGSNLIGEDYAFAYGGAAIPNYPPETPDKPVGPTAGRPGVSYIYSSKTNDPDGDQIYYMFDWNDGSYSDWLGPFLSGDVVTISHMWATPGIFTVRLKAMDSYGTLSQWSEPLDINISKSKATYKLFFMQLLENHLYLSSLLRHILIRN
jgi:hypothetical protein